MALYPAPDMTSGAVSLWVAGAEQAERGAGAGAGARPLGHRRRRGRIACGDERPLSLPRARCAASLRPPADKSISHRAALIAAMGEGETQIVGYLDAADTRSTLAAVRSVGARRSTSAPQTPSRQRRGRAAARRSLRIRGVGPARAAPGGDRRRQRRHPAAAAARLARRAGRRGVDARRRRLDPAPPGRPRRRPAA